MRETLATFLTATILAAITTVFWPECTPLWAIPSAVMLGIVAVSKKLERK